MSTPLLTGLAPVVSARTRMIILGSFPGVASLVAQQYYGHPQNQFWKILQALWPAEPLPGQGDYAGRCAWLLQRRLGVWDVYAACEREGSLDSKIRHGALNDFSALLAACPDLRAIAHNGGESFRHAVHTRQLGCAVERLPSSSPAHAAWSFEQKLAAWRAVFEKHEMI